MLHKLLFHTSGIREAFHTEMTTKKNNEFSIVGENKSFLS
jgi:hypothetical protein